MGPLKLLMLIPITTVLFLSCKGENGVDGLDGRAFLTVTSSDGLLYAYIDNNSSRPGIFYAGQTYRVVPGLYDYAYESRDYNTDGTYYYAQWIGRYSIHINEGEEGSEGKIFWQSGEDGENGADSYLTLLCNFDGPYQNRINKIQKGTVRTIPDSVVTMKILRGEYVLNISATLKLFGKKTTSQSE